MTDSAKILSILYTLLYISFSKLFIFISVVIKLSLVESRKVNNLSTFSFKILSTDFSLLISCIFSFNASSFCSYFINFSSNDSFILAYLSTNIFSVFLMSVNTSFLKCNISILELEFIPVLGKLTSVFSDFSWFSLLIIKFYLFYFQN